MSQQLDWYYENRQKYIERQLAYYRKNRKKVLEYQTKYKKEHQEKYRKINLKYIQKKNFAGLREEVIQRDKERCVLCGMTRQEHKEKYARDIAVDHINGRNIFSQNPDNSKENLRTLCIVCNLQRGYNPQRKKIPN